MNTSFSTSTRGFSLIEVLVYIAVTVLVAVAAVLTYLSLDTTLVRHETERAVNHAATVALEHLSRDLREATSVDTSESTLGSSPGELTLAIGTTTVNFSVSSNTLMYSRNGVSMGPLTGSDVSVDAFTIYRYVGTSTEMVRVLLTLSSDSKAASTTRMYYVSTVLRGSYD